MGLLTSLLGLTPEQTQGLLGFSSALAQASAPSDFPTSGAQGIAAALQGYQKGVNGYQDRQQQQAAAAQAAQLRDLQIQSAQSDLDAQNLARQHTQGLNDAIAAFYKGDAPSVPAFPGGQSATNLMGGMIAGQSLPSDQPASSAALPATDRNSIAQQRLRLAAYLYSQPGFSQDANKIADEAIKLQPKFSTDFRVALGADGKLHNYLLSDDGSLKDAGLGVKPDIASVDTGGAQQFYDKNAIAPGTVFKKTQSPDSMAADARAANSGTDASLNDATLDVLADQALRGDTSVYQNLGRGAQGAANLVALRTRVAQKAAAQGLTGGDLASINADYQGQKAGLRTSGTISARIENAASEAAQLAPLAINAGRQVSRSGFLPFGQAQVMFNTQTNDPNLNRFATANIGLANAYAGAMARGGKATVSDNQHARDLLSTAKSQDAYEAIVGQMMQEIQAAQAAPQHVRSNLRGQISGGGAETNTVPNPLTPTPQQAASSPNIPLGAVNLLKMNPKLRDQFDAKYGAGAAASILGR